jgi:hypothetical protein
MRDRRPVSRLEQVSTPSLHHVGEEDMSVILGMAKRFADQHDVERELDRVQSLEHDKLELEARIRALTQLRPGETAGASPRIAEPIRPGTSTTPCACMQQA